MPELTNEILYYGGLEYSPLVRILNAGQLSICFDSADGCVRYIRFGQHELLRGIYAAVRDHNWDTVTPVMQQIHYHQSKDEFRIEYSALCEKDSIRFQWSGLVEGNAGRTLKYTLNGEALSAFQRNRIGFCVLHPMECAGLPCQIEHIDGSTTNHHFPIWISPHQPFKNIRSITHVVADETKAVVRMEGSTFEMEDQRNWTDASYKTYCTPLAEPFPVTIEKGTKIHQSITVNVLHPLSYKNPHATAKPYVHLQVDSTKQFPLPKIGLGSASHGEPLSKKEIVRLQCLQLDHIRLDLHLYDINAQRNLAQAVKEAAEVGVTLELALFFSADMENELSHAVQWMQSYQNCISSILIYHADEKTTSHRTIQSALIKLKPFCGSIPIGSGTNAYFTELNRTRPPVEEMDFACYSINPQIHAFDNQSLTETLAAQAVTVQSAKQILNNKPVHITPVTLKPRFNPNATGPEPQPNELPAHVDVRQMALFGAAWTMGSIKNLSQSGADSVTYFETTGWRGIMERESGSTLPEQFCSSPGMVFPLYHIFAALASFHQGYVIHSCSDQPLKVDGMILRIQKQTRMILSNFTNQCQLICVDWIDCPKQVSIKQLNEKTYKMATAQPEQFIQYDGILMQTHGSGFEIGLLPYATAWIGGVL